MIEIHVQSTLLYEQTVFVKLLTK